MEIPGFIFFVVIMAMFGSDGHGFRWFILLLLLGAIDASQAEIDPHVAQAQAVAERAIDAAVGVPPNLSAEVNDLTNDVMAGIDGEEPKQSPSPERSGGTWKEM